MVKAIFFDWMGTLGNVSDTDAIGECLSREQMHSLVVSSFEDADIPKCDREVIKKYLDEAVLGLYDDTRKVLELLRDKGYSLVVVSNMYPITTDKVRRQFGDLLSFFEVVNLSSEIGMRKPNKDIFLDALEKLNNCVDEEILPEDVLMVGDNLVKDFEASQNCGMKAVLIDREKQGLKDVLLGVVL